MRCGRRPPSTRSASTITRRSPTGAARRGELDRALTETIYDPAYLAGNLRGGEAYDWYYADDAARAAQTRSPITDGLGKPWMFRAKDLWNWWASPHYERVGGAELGSPTAWTPQGKPIWLTEIGCPAVDKGANQPSTFPGSEIGRRRRAAFLQRPARRSHAAAASRSGAARRSIPRTARRDDDNPVSSVYGGRMIAPDAIHLWTWDARPYPIFPAATDVWSDGPNWETGHWLTGRLGGAPLDALIAAILDDAGIGDFDSSALTEIVDGYVIDRPMSPRAAIEPLALAYAFDAGEADGKLVFRPRGGDVRAEIGEDDLLLPDDRAPARLVRAQETELAARGVAVVHRRRRRLSPLGGDVAAADRRRGAHQPCRSRGRHQRRQRRAPRQHLAAGPVGRAREPPSSRCRRAISRLAPAT